MTRKKNLHLSRLKTWKAALATKSFPFEFSLGANDYWAMLFVCCISLFAPKLFWLIPLYLGSKMSKKIIVKKSRTQQSELALAITFIETNQLESLCEAIESNPTLLQCEYKHKTLLSWCEFYHNTNAFMVVDKIRKKSTVKAPLAA